MSGRPTLLIILSLFITLSLTAGTVHKMIELSNPGGNSIQNWSAMTSDSRIELDHYEGSLPEGETEVLELTFPEILTDEKSAEILFFFEATDLPVIVKPGTPGDVLTVSAAVPPDGGTTSEISLPAFFHPEGCSACLDWKEEWSRHPALGKLNLYNAYESGNFTLLSRISRERGRQVEKMPVLVTEEGLYQGFTELNRYLAEGEFTLSESDTLGSTMNVLTILAAGFMDGINPCAMATLLFLIALLTMNGASRKQATRAGISFIASIFLTYFLIGLGLFTVLRQLPAGTTFLKIINDGFAVGLFILAVLNFRDARLARAGRFTEMTLQLSRKRKQAIHGFLRRAMTSPALPAAVFLLGILITLYELGCTGQIYLPTLMFMVKNGNTAEGIGGLLIYNFSFIIPLTAVYLLFLAGKGSKDLNSWFSDHVAAVKAGTGALFIVLAALLLVI